MENKQTVPVSVIIVNYKTKELTYTALVSLYRSSVLPREIILVDNHSEDGLVEIVRKDFPEVVVIVNKENVGFAKANNRAIREYSTQPYIWLLNSDTETGEKSLEELYVYMNSYTKIGALGPQLMYPTGEWQSVGGFFPTISNVFIYLIPITIFLPKKNRQRLKSIALFPQPILKDGIELDYVTGAACMLRKEALEEVGLLAEDYFMYFEETDLCFRLKKAGWIVRAIDTDPVMHVYGGSFKTKYDEKRLRLFLKGLRIFIKKYIKGLPGLVMIGEIVCLGQISLLLKRLKSKI